MKLLKYLSVLKNHDCQELKENGSRLSKIKCSKVYQNVEQVYQKAKDKINQNQDQELDSTSLKIKMFAKQCSDFYKKIITGITISLLFCLAFDHLFYLKEIICRSLYVIDSSLESQCFERVGKMLFFSKISLGLLIWLMIGKTIGSIIFYTPLYHILTSIMELDIGSFRIFIFIFSLIFYQFVKFLLYILYKNGMESKYIDYLFTTQSLASSYLKSLLIMICILFFFFYS